MLDELVLPQQISQSIENHDWLSLAHLKKEWPDAEIAAPYCLKILAELTKKDKILFFRALPEDLQVMLVSSMEGQEADELLVQLTDAEAREILQELSVDDRTYLLAELPGKLTHRLMRLLTPEDQRQALNLLGYPKDSVGRLMTSGYIRIKPHWTVERALNHIREQGQEVEHVTMVYVTELGGKIVDALSLRELVLARPESLVEDLMDYTFVSLSPYDDREKAVQLMQTYGRSALPIVDKEGYIIGLVTFDDVFEVAQEEVTEDFHKRGAIIPLKTSYLLARALDLIKSRLGWLSILLVVNLLSSSVIGFFEELLAANIVLAFFIPLLIDTAGNTGSQASSMMIRGISTGEVDLNDWWRALFREVFIGLLIGISVGAMGFGLGLVRGGYLIGLVVFLTLVTMLFLSNVIGILLPFIFTRLKLDPAVASGPLITSIADALGLLIYFQYANLILEQFHG